MIKTPFGAFFLAGIGTHRLGILRPTTDRVSPTKKFLLRKNKNWHRNPLVTESGFFYEVAIKPQPSKRIGMQTSRIW